MRNITYVTKEDVTNEQIVQALALDRISYDEEYFLDAETCFAYYEKNPNIYIMAVDDSTRSVVGYINFSPVNKEMYDALISGQVIDTAIRPDDISTYRDHNEYYGYMSSIVVRPDKRKHGIATEMLEILRTFICKLAIERDIYFLEIVADAVSDVGNYILSKMGFSLVGSSGHDTRIMRMKLLSGKTRVTPYNEQILNVYKNRRREMKNGI